MADFDLVPVVSVNPDKIVVYFEGTRHRRSISGDFEQPEQFKNNNHNSLISSTASKKIKKAATYLIFCANEQKQFNHITKKTIKFKIVFITLTLSSKQIHSDNEIKSQLLNQFIVELKRKYKVTKYVWRAEKQINGNIHFHFLIDKFIPCNELTNLWNRIQNKLGYVDRYRENMLNYFSQGFRMSNNPNDKRTREQQIKAYKKGIATDFRQPNSTDIHSLRLITNIKAYISKYLSKNEQSAEQIGRLWGCSTDLSHIKGGTDNIDSEISAELQRLRESEQFYIIDDNYYSVFCVDFSNLILYNCKRLISILLSYCKEKFNYVHQLSTFY